MVATKKMILAGLAIASIASAGLFSQNVLAGGPEDRSTLARAIADELHVTQEEVESALEEFRLEKRAEREAGLQAELAAAVDEGSLTSIQKGMLLAKRQEIRQALENIHQLTGSEERQQAVHQLAGSVKNWAHAEGIALRWLRASGA